MNKTFKVSAGRESKLNKSTLFMRISVVLLVLIVVKVVIDLEITANIWVLFGFFVASITLGLGYGISYLNTTAEIQELKGDING